MNTTTEAAGIVQYCKDCKKIIEGKKVGRRCAFSCPLCKGKNVAFGTEKSITSFYHIKEEAPEKEEEKK